MSTVETNYNANNPVPPILLVNPDQLPNLERFARFSVQARIANPQISKLDFERTDVKHSPWYAFRWCEEYSNDIIATIKTSEKFRKKLKFSSPQLIHRTNLIILMEIASNTLDLSRTTKHLATYYLDCFMDAFKVPDDKLDLIAMTCLLLASKLEDVDVKIPKMDTLNCFVKYNFEKSIFSYVEKSIIKCFSWDLMHPTAATYVELYYVNLVHDEDILPWENAQQLKLFARCELFEYLNTTIYDIRLANEPPSLIAAACMFATRKMLQIRPSWPKRLKLLTGYSRKIFLLFASTIIEQRKMLKAYYQGAQTPDSGISDNVSVDEEDDDNSNNEDSSTDSEDGIEHIRDYFLEPKRARLI